MGKRVVICIMFLRRSHSIRDAKVRWHVGYAHHYRKNIELTKHYIHLCDMFDREVTAIHSWNNVGEGEVIEILPK